MRQLHHQFDMMLEVRVGERTRIARELHDTLLQGFHGLLLRFQTASYLLPDRPAEAKDKLDVAIEHAAKAITEGRDAVQGLRASTLERTNSRWRSGPLGTSSRPTRAASSRLRSVSQSRARRVICTRLFVTRSYKIAAEALRNAFRHAHAGRVEVEIRYDDEQFRIARA